MSRFRTDKLRRLVMLNFERLNPDKKSAIYEKLRHIPYLAQSTNGISFGSAHLGILVFFLLTKFRNEDQ